MNLDHNSKAESDARRFAEALPPMPTVESDEDFERHRELDARLESIADWGEAEDWTDWADGQR